MKTKIKDWQFVHTNKPIGIRRVYTEIVKATGKHIPIKYYITKISDISNTEFRERAWLQDEVVDWNYPFYTWIGG